MLRLHFIAKRVALMTGRVTCPSCLAASFAALSNLQGQERKE
jgi:hypothetical protein